nr:MAG TPA: hypothetical protein [Caudoviricetes sp.]
MILSPQSSTNINKSYKRTNFKHLLFVFYIELGWFFICKENISSRNEQV